MQAQSNFKSSALYAKIEAATEKHRHQQLNFRFKGDEMLRVLEQLPQTPELTNLINSVFSEALQKSDKRPMLEQLTLKQKYQKSHGLVFKDIPIHVQRHVIYDAILKLGRTMNMDNGQLAFPGACKMRSFFFPEVKKNRVGQQTHRVCFPIFVNKRDQMYLYQWSQNQNGTIQLEIDEEAAQWDGIVSVELTRDATEDSDDVDDITVKARSKASPAPIDAMTLQAAFSNMSMASSAASPQPPHYMNPLMVNPNLGFYSPYMHSPPMPINPAHAMQFNPCMSYPVSNISTSPTNESIEEKEEKPAVTA